MRSVRFLAFCPRGCSESSWLAQLSFMGMGCHQHYYYYGDACPPGTPVPSTVRAGTVCDVPTQVVEGGTKLAAGSSRSTVVSGAVSSNSSKRGRQRAQRARESRMETIRSRCEPGDDRARGGQRPAGQSLRSGGPRNLEWPLSRRLGQQRDDGEIKTVAGILQDVIDDDAPICCKVSLLALDHVLEQ